MPAPVQAPTAPKTVPKTGPKVANAAPKAGEKPSKKPPAVSEGAPHPTAKAQSRKRQLDEIVAVPTPQQRASEGDGKAGFLFFRCYL